MKIYITTNNKKIIKKYYPEIVTSDTAVFDVPVYIKKYNYTNIETDKIQQYILNQDIQRILNNFYRSKRFRSILYITKNIDEDFIDDFRNFLDSEKIYFTEYILIDFDDDIDHSLYNFFTTVI